MNSSMGQYWLLYYQPVPETGERIAAGLVIQDRGKRSQVEFDSKFSKVLKVFPSTDPDTLAFYFQSLAEQIDRGTSIESTLNAFGPQLVPSKPRNVISPVSAEVVNHLVARYLLPDKKLRRRRERTDGVAKEIESFVRAAGADNIKVQKNVSARDVLGRSISGAKRIALAMRFDDAWALIDGVDLNQSTPKQATERADEIARTYWNYSRVASQSGIQLKRVGIVLNGNSHCAPNSLEAHDYALHRFQADSDLAIDAAQPGSRVELRNLIEKLIHQ